MGSRTGSPTRAASPHRAASPRKSPAKSVAKKSPAKRKVVKKSAAHPSYKEMVIAAITALKQRGGSSRQAISKYIAAHYKVSENSNSFLRAAIKRALASGVLVANANHSGTFRINKDAVAPPKPKKKKVTAKKPAAKKAKKATPKKKVAPKKKKATPKKAKKTPTKSKKSAGKSATKKKPVKKTAAKKVVKKTAAKKSKK